MASGLGMREASGLFLVCLLLLGTAVADQDGGAYYCLEDYKPIGSLLRNVRVAAEARTTPRTGGQVARACAAACNAAPECSGFRAVGPEVKGGSTCQLLANSTQSLPTALAFAGPSTPWPKVNANLTAVDRIALRSISWMCWRQQQDWDRFGAATHNMIVSGDTEGSGREDDHKDWCAFGVDVAGTNLRRDYINITHPQQCDAICKQNATGCTMWIFVASRPEQVQFQPEMNCFAKADAFRGQNGWTGKPKSDIWIADSQVTCFSNLPDWRHLGLVLSPSIKTIQQDSSYFTVYPERVTWSEAAATCKQLPGGQLAILDSQALVDRVSRDLLDTLPFHTAVRSAWVGATGNNTAYNPAAPNISDLAGNASGNSGRLQQALPPREKPTTPPEATLRWTGGSLVAPGLLRRPDSLTQLWTVHDVVWGQQYVPESSKDVCGRVMVQLPPSTGPVNPASVLPGIWYYDCDKPGAFICQSSSPPTEPMSGREVTPSKVADSSSPGSSDGGGGVMQPWKTALAVILPVLFVALLALQVFHIYSRKVSRLPEIIRQQRKRALGQPRTGRMSLVMTDIQGFTRLMESNADNTTQALLLHNSIIKHAVYQNVGWVVEQEGDSFSVVFHEAEDAVAFTLQVQQALLVQNWPRGVAYQDDWEGATSFLDCRSASQQTDDPAASVAVAEAGTPQQGDSFSWQEGDPDAASAAGASPSQASSCSMGLAAMRQQLLNMRPGGRSSSFTASGGSASKPFGHRRSHSQENGHGGPDQQQQPQTDMAERIDSTVSGVSSNSARAARVGSVTPEDARGVWSHIRGHSPSLSQLAPSSPSFAGSAPPTAAVPAATSPASRKSVLGSRPRNLWLFQQLLGPRQEQQKLFCGLRVRMGVVTGEVERGQELKSSALYRSAQDVSNAAHGGQVLMDELTFAAVKEAMWRLGAVGPNGLDYDALLATKQSARHSMSGSSSGGGSSCMGDGCLPGPGRSLRRDMSGLSAGSSQLPAVGGSTLALALDMGCYEILTPSDPAYPGHVNSSVSSMDGALLSPRGKQHSRGRVCVQLWTRELGERLVQQYQQYIQQQLSRQGALDSQDDLGRDNSFDEEAPYMLHGRLGALQEQQHPALHQQQHPHLGLGAGLRQLSVGRSSNRSLGGAGGHVVDAGDRQLGASRKQQLQQQHSPRAGMVGRSASMTVPHSWQQMTSSLFGVGLVHPDSEPDGLASSSSFKASRRGLTNLQGFCSISAVLRRNVRLYQIVAPTLAGRAALFGQQLDLPAAWRLLDQPYFAAPGLSSASLLAAQEAAMEAAASEQAAGGGDTVSDTLRTRVPGRVSSEVAPWQQQGGGMAGRSSSEMHPSPNNLQELQTQMRAASARDAALVAAVQQAAGTPAAATSPTAAAGQRGDSAPPGLLGDAVEGGGDGSSYLEPSGKPISQSSSSPFLPAAQHRLSSSETGSASLSDAVQAAAAAAAAAAGQQGTGSPPHVAGWTTTDRQQPTSPHLARLNSSSTHGGQLALSVLPQQQQRLAAPMSPAAAGNSSFLTANQSLLVLRAASLQLNVSPSVLLASSDRRSMVGTPGQRRVSGPARALFPPVTILFAAVEGSGELLRYPALARSVHGMVHHLMLQLLHAFPGSYLVRAQQGDLKYMLAFTSPAAAVSWGLTLQEASLYLPYPQEVLGLGSFGVQLDEGGRLVFRGPRFKMGLSEGSPKAIMPDHLGRADYHGSFVNLASRYAAVAAQGGQLVTDAELARQVLWHWKACGLAAAAGHTNGAVSSSQADTFGNFSGFTSVLRSQPTGSETSNVQQWASLLQQQSSLPAVQAAAGAGSDAAPNKSSSSSGATVPGSAAAAAAGSSDVLVIQPTQGALCVSPEGPEAAGAAGSSSSAGGVAVGTTAEVPVECCWLGSFLFKGNPSPVSMVNFSPAVLSGRHYAPPAMSSSKGVRVLQRVGVMDRALVRLPAAVEGFGPWEHTGVE